MREGVAAGAHLSQVAELQLIQGEAVQTQLSAEEEEALNPILAKKVSRVLTAGRIVFLVIY